MNAQPFTDAFAALPAREALRLLKTLAERFSGHGYGYDRVDAGIEQIAAELAEEEGWRPGPGENECHVAERFLSAPDRFGPGYATTVMIADAGWYGGVFGG